MDQTQINHDLVLHLKDAVQVGQLERRPIQERVEGRVIQGLVRVGGMSGHPEDFGRDILHGIKHDSDH